MIKNVVKDEQKIDFDIQPKASIMGVFSRLSYRHEYAIAEFVDNSTQSFYSHKEEMDIKGITKIEIRIAYDSQSRFLVIKDSAFGMDLKDFKRAILMDSLPEEVNSRNEFGMGLKTAASWFGNAWSVESTALGNNEKYYAKIDIKQLRETESNIIPIKVTKCSLDEHFTTIKIFDVTKNMSNNTLKNVKTLLGSMYRRDIASGKVVIKFDGKPLEFEPYKPLNFRDRIWKKDVDFSFYFGDKKYRVKGFVGILENGGYNDAGLALFRRNRIVIGGFGRNYKPLNIFSQSQSQISLKLYGELDMDDFPVNQAKDGFIWNEGLEEAFLENLRSNINEYIVIAEMSKKARNEEIKENEFNEPEYWKKIEEKINSSYKLLNNDEITIDEQVKSRIINAINSKDVHFEGYDELKDNESINEYAKGLLTEKDTFKEIGFPRNYNLQIIKDIYQKFSVSWVNSSEKKWINVKGTQGDEYIEVLINVKHPFFMPYANEEEFKIVLEKFVIAFVLAEIKAKMESTDGRVLPDTIRIQIDKILAKIGG